MCRFEVGEDGKQRFGIANFLVFGGIVLPLLNRYFGMGSFEAFVEKLNVADDTESVGKDTSLLSIAEMAVYVLAFDVAVGKGTVRHEGIDHLVRGLDLA